MNTRFDDSRAGAERAAAVTDFPVALPAFGGGQGTAAVDVQTLARCFSICNAFSAANREVLGEFGVTAQQCACLVETHCAEAQGPLTVGELAERLRVRHNTAVGAITQLCEQGLLLRVRDSQDGRKVRVKLTKKGQQTLEQLARAYWQALREIEPELFAQVR